MVKDRLPQLLSERTNSQNRRKTPKGNNLELDHVFLKKLANVLHKTIEELKNHIVDGKIIHRNILASPNDNAELDRQLNHLNEAIKEKLHIFRKMLNANLNEKDPLIPSAQERMHQVEYAALSKGFVDTLQLYNKCQLEYRAMSGHRFSEDQVENMLGKKNPEICTQFIMADTEAAKRSLSDIEARHIDLMQVEESIKELQDLFVTFAAIVEQQSQLVDRIENNITKTVAAVDCAVEQLKSAQLEIVALHYTLP